MNGFCFAYRVYKQKKEAVKPPFFVDSNAVLYAYTKAKQSAVA